MTAQNAPRRDINERVGDRERDITCNELVRHFSDGRLTEQEMRDRTEAALSARTKGDLYELLADLPRIQSPVPPTAWVPRQVGSKVYDVVLGFFSISAVLCFLLLSFLLALGAQAGVILLFLGALAGSVATLGICHFTGRGRSQPRSWEHGQYLPPQTRFQSF